MYKTSIPQLVAHRGYLQCFPENSWRGLEAALKAGAGWLEFDIQLSGGGEFVLLHDDNFARTSGIDQSVFDMQNHQVNISVHEPERFGDRFAPTPLVTLIEVLHILRAFPRVRVMVELKQESIDRWGLDTVMQKLAPLLAAHQPQCVLISFKLEALQWCRNSYPHIRIGWVLRSYDHSSRIMADNLQADYLICNEQKLSRVQTPWPGSWQWMLYDIIVADKALNWAACGIDLIETAAIGSLLQDPRFKSVKINHGI